MRIPYVFERLHRQIFFTVIVCLLAILVVTGLAALILDRDNQRDNPFDTTARLARLMMPPATTPVPEVKKFLFRVGEEIEMDIALYDVNRQPVAAYGPLGPPPKFKKWLPGGEDRGWQFGQRGRLVMKLDDGRWLVVRRYKGSPTRAIFSLLAFVGLACLGIGLGALPFVRRLTGRLERLQTSVEEIGAGDLSARAMVEGRDEVAGLATSFNDAAARIERLVTSNKLLLANASHELRTPLSRIRLGVEMLKKNRTEEREQALEKDIAELDGLIDEILLMSRLDSDTKPKLGDHVDLLALAAEECAHYQDCTVSGNSALVDGDARLLRRMLRNLVDNAAKHGEPPIVVDVSTREATIILAVTDGGAGIAPKDREHVFEPFYRSSDRQNVDGFGLGLALVRQIAEVHNGIVEIDTERVSTIIVTLPKAAV